MTRTGAPQLLPPSPDDLDKTSDSPPRASAQAATSGPGRFPVTEATLDNGLRVLIQEDPRNPIVRFLYAATEPILRPFRRILPPRRTGGIDFSPLLVILLIFFIKRVLARLLLAPPGLTTF